MVVTAPVSGDALFLGGVASVRAPITGDMRALAWSITSEEPIAGDFVAFGGSINTSSLVGKSVFILGANVTLTGGAVGPVTVYGNNVVLGGNFSGDVRVVASGRVALAPGTHIKGALSYEAPEPATVPADASVAGGIKYTGSSYLPTKNEVHALALAGVGIFLFVRILALLILAGLLAGLFPRLAEQVTIRARQSVRRVLLTTLLGFAAIVATPVLLILLSLTFVGFGIALLVLVVYILLLVLSFIYAGILLGGYIASRFWRRETIIWRDGVLGMFLLSLFMLLPIVGTLIAFILSSFAAGALLILFFHFAFPHETETEELL